MVLRDIEGYEGRYSVSDDGRVWSYRRFGSKGGWMKLVPHRQRKYMTVGLYDGNKKYIKFMVHQLVAKAFIPNPQKLTDINHKDGNGLNNIQSNLEWSSDRDNQIHALKTGLKPYVVPISSAKKVIDLYQSGKHNQRELASMFNCGQSTISRIVRGVLLYPIEETMVEVEA